MAPGKPPPPPPIPAADPKPKRQPDPDPRSPTGQWRILSRENYGRRKVPGPRWKVTLHHLGDAVLTAMGFGSNRQKGDKPRWWLLVYHFVKAVLIAVGMAVGTPLGVWIAKRLHLI